jgi:hypothetical protein
LSGRITLQTQVCIDGKTPDTDVRMTWGLEGAGKPSTAGADEEARVELKMSAEGHLTRKGVP